MELWYCGKNTKGNKMTKAIISILLAYASYTGLASLPPGEPNEKGLEQFVHCWMYENKAVDKVLYFQLGDISDPNFDPNNPKFARITVQTPKYHPLLVWDFDSDLITTLKDFAVLSACWTGKVVEPNIPICFRIKACETCKEHLYLTCGSLAGKETEIVACDPNNICLKCLNRRMAEWK